MNATPRPPRPPRLVEVRRNALKQNDMLARSLRDRFRKAGVRVISMVSSPGAGKTTLLEKTLVMLLRQWRVAALVGDLATENDAARLARSQAPVKQIITGEVCHLDATMVERAIDGWNLDELDLLFIENVGNLVCPASYDLGEDLRLVLLSVTEGEDKALKYPTIFNTADVAVITKIDLAGAVEFDLAAARHNIHQVRPGMEIVEVSSKTGEGMEAWLRFLQHQRGEVLNNVSCDSGQGCRDSG
ncbi:MAG TPA: hydrogenase nickel incorporation protein HypB [Blastocatellia bacterium]